MAESLSVITGAGSGIGKALAIALAKEDFNVLAIGRRQETLTETQQANPSKIQTLVADIGTIEGRESIVNYFKSHSNIKINFLIQNAAVLRPAGRLSEISLQDWREHQAINVDAPLFITQQLLPYFSDGSRILHVSSGFAHSPQVGWGCYCLSKSAFFMLYQLLRDELKENNIFVGSARPGVVDTPMQDLVRSFDPKEIPNVEFFRKLKEKSKLLSPEVVADFFMWLLTKTTGEEFSEKEWDITEWLKK
jgi:benzil reductase ((S)-benzoin forming)